MPSLSHFVLAALLVCVDANAADPEADFKDWPANWASAYRRFEKFIATQNEYVPPSDLKISPDGAVLTSLPDDVDRERLTTLVVYREGAQIFAMGLKGTLLTDGPVQRSPPGLFAACLKTSDKLVGYQFRHPLTWFQTAPEGDGTRGRMLLQTIEQPQPADDFWPNDRLLRFYDFQVLPHINPLTFIRENNKVMPNVHLAVTRSGVVLRESLDDSLEPMLHWRIYLNGRVVEKGTAAHDVRHAVQPQMGTYVAFVGVEGPDGFMPVSNFLQFPLFPERDGSMTVIPSLSDVDPLPQCIIDVLAPDELSQIRALARQFKADARGGAMYYGVQHLPPAGDPQKQALLSLWSAWGYNVDLVRGNPDYALRIINMAKPEK